jgi:outer membrane immunogenic protein
MRKLLLGSAALIAMSVASMGGPAVAADMPVKARPLPPVYTWTGCYLGAFVSYEFGRSKHVAETPGVVGVEITPYFHMSGFNGGFDGGCNYQFGAWVIGFEVDGAASNKDGQHRDLPPFNTAFINQTSEQWLVTARGRIGYAWDKTLIYVTGGGAWARVETVEWNTAAPTLRAEDKRTISGWTIGAGWEYALGYGWSIKSEYLYMNFGWHRFFAPPITPGNCGCVEADVFLDNHVFKLGMNYKFDWYTPVVAKY